MFTLFYSQEEIERAIEEVRERQRVELAAERRLLPKSKRDDPNCVCTLSFTCRHCLSNLPLSGEN